LTFSAVWRRRKRIARMRAAKKGITYVPLYADDRDPWHPHDDDEHNSLVGVNGNGQYEMAPASGLGPQVRYNDPYSNSVPYYSDATPRPNQQQFGLPPGASTPQIVAPSPRRHDSTPSAHDLDEGVRPPSK